MPLLLLAGGWVGGVHVVTEAFTTLCVALRRWAPLIIDSAPDEDSATGERMLLERLVSWASQSQSRLEPLLCGTVAYRDAANLPAAQHRRFSARQLVCSVLFAWHLRDNVGVDRTLPLCIEQLSPGILSRDVFSQGYRAIPSRSLLRASQLALDAALMYVRREVNSSAGAVRYGWADSSTVAGSDWLVSKHQCIELAGIAAAAEAWRGLVRMRLIGDIHVDVSERKRLSRALWKEVRLYTQVPQTMGAGTTTVEHKVSALAFAFFLEVKGLAGLREFLDSVISFTTDMGTELGAASFRLPSLKSLLPQWLQQPHIHPDIEVDVPDADAEILAEFSGGMVSFLPRALIIPGALHIISNLSADISLKLLHWKEFVDQCKVLGELLCDKDRRERFSNTCIPAGHRAAAKFVSFSGSIYEKCWGAVVAFVQKLLDVLPELREFWSDAKYLRNFKERDDAKDGNKVSAREVTHILKSDLFMVFAETVLIVFNSLEELGSWCEGCSCHEDLLRGKTGHVSRKSLAKWIGTSDSDCPMKGKRAPELAAGHLQTVFTADWNRHVSKLWEKAADCQLSEEDIAILREDMERARSHLELGMQIKLDFWERLPWKLIAMAHWDCAIARQNAQSCLDMYNDLSDVDPEYVHHPLTISFLHEPGSLRRHVMDFVAGEPMSDELRTEVDKLTFIPVVERSIEAKHSIIKCRTANRLRSGRNVSLALRVPDIREDFRRDAGCMERLVDAFREVRSPSAAAQILGIAGHPDIVVALRLKKKPAFLTAALNRIFYRADFESKFADHSVIRSKHFKEEKRRLRRGVAELKRKAPVVAEPITDRSVMETAILHHFRSVVDHTRFYSIELKPAEGSRCQELCSVDGVLSMPMSKRSRTAAWVGQPDVDGEERRVEFGGIPVINVRVVHANPSRMKTVRVPLAAGRRHEPNDFAVTVHNDVDVGGGALHVDIAPRRVGKSAVVLLKGFATLDIDHIQDTFTCCVLSGLQTVPCILVAFEFLSRIEF